MRDRARRPFVVREGDCFVSLSLGLVVVVRWCPSGACVVRDCQGAFWILDRRLPREDGVSPPPPVAPRVRLSHSRRGV